ncbi:MULTISPECIES: hypothetical protein [Streptomyces]|uniref:Uncharacterized protein n=2 Tax=Streptomyces fradiae ATCC 10745 = DSM 40063 TaxID=1319510 RepID=A0A1Y2NWC3_STRFR|nr:MULTISPECIES: hypothetical protein [Streptomyces]OSY51842.1 hypothetical protein BG846_02516 [Streptomyces fradiae ATCC 10745 = DSM 40063]
MRPTAMRIGQEMAAAVQAQAAIATDTPVGMRQATVATVGTDGTVTTVEGFVARRLATYTGPAVGDLVLISPGPGGWYAHGRMAAASAGGWVPLTLASGWSATAGYYTPAYRLNGDGTASLSGMASMSGTLAAGAVVTTLPAEARPANRVRVTVQVAAASGTGYYGVMTINPDGTVTLGDYSAALPGTGSKYAEYDVLSHYRLT